MPWGEYDGQPAAGDDGVVHAGRAQPRWNGKPSALSKEDLAAIQVGDTLDHTQACQGTASFACPSYLVPLVDILKFSSPHNF